MEYTPIGAVTAVANPAADRAPAYGCRPRWSTATTWWPSTMPWPTAAERARAGDGPTVIEAQTYRHYGHSRTDPATYRPAEEVERWLKHDPLDIARARLEASASPEDDDRAGRRACGRGRRGGRGGGEGRAGGRIARGVHRRVGGRRCAWRRGGPDTITYREAVAEGIAREMRRDPTRGVPRRGHRRGRRASSRRPSGCSRSSVRSGSGTRPSPSRPSSAPRWARR